MSEHLQTSGRPGLNPIILLYGNRKVVNMGKQSTLSASAALDTNSSGSGSGIWGKIKNWFILLFLPVGLFVLWELATHLGWVRASVLPSPEEVVRSAVLLVQKDLFFADLFATLGRIAKGFVIGASIGIVFGILIGIFPTMDKATKVLIAIFRPIPTISIIPILILWLGIGETSKVTVIVLGTFWALMLNTISGIKSVDPKLLELAKMLRKSRSETIFQVILPYAFPSIFTGIRLAASSSLAMSVTAEMIAAQNGIGYRIMYARNMAMPGIMFVGIVELGILGMAIDLILLKIQDRIFQYR